MMKPTRRQAVASIAAAIAAPAIIRPASAQLSINNLTGFGARRASTSAGSTGYSDYNAVDFDGTNDYLSRGADLTGAADGKLGTLSVWLRPDTDGVLGRIFSVAGGGSGVRPARTAANIFAITLTNAAGTIISNRSTSNSYLKDSWYHLLSSWDLGNNIHQIYVNDVSDDNGSALTDDNIDYTGTDWFVGALSTPSQFWDGGMAEFWFNPTYVDLSAAANRRKFITAGLKPESLGSDGSTPTGSQPLIYCHVGAGGAASAFGTNLGSGGGFTVTGSLDIASNKP